MKKETKTETKDWKKMLVDLEKKLDEFFGEKAPKLPASVVEFLVKYGPYFMIIGIVVSAVILLMSIGLLAAIMPLSRMGYGYGYMAAYGYHYGFELWNIFGLIVMVLQAMAIPGLFKRTKSAWNLMFYASLVNVFSSLFNGGLISAAIGTAISWYFLFQIRKSYK
jgi:hypothetical protein